MSLAEEARRAASLLTDHATARLVVRANDPDALAAGVLLAFALDREGIHFQLTASDRLDERIASRLREEKNDVLVLAGLSPGAIGVPAPGLAENVIVLDRDGAPGTGDGPTLTAATSRLDGAFEASNAAFAQVLANHLSRKNGDLVVLALAGSMADGQHVGGWRGLNAELLGDAVAKDVVTREPSLCLEGPSVLEAVAQCTEPFFPGLSGRARAVKRFLGDLNLPADAAPANLARKDRARVASALALHLVEHDAPEGALDLLLPHRVSPKAGPLGMEESWRLARRFAACAAEGRGPAAVASVWGERTSADEAEACEGEHRQHLLQALMRVEREHAKEADGKGPHVADAPTAGLAVPLARLAYASVTPADRPLVVFAEAGGTFEVEARCHRALGKQGVDLGAAFRDAAEKTGGRAVGGKYRARALVRDRAAFMERVASELALPGGGGAA